MSKFVMAADTPRDTFDWGSTQWISHPPLTGSKQLTVIDAEFLPGKSHSFHMHPDQEETILCLSGSFEQWIGEEKRTLQAGDAVHIDAGVVHATFNDSDEPAHFLAILSPCVGEEGYELVDVSDQEPWCNLR
jgi:quercetin dioxygenase-like cupin family protein